MRGSRLFIFITILFFGLVGLTACGSDNASQNNSRDNTINENETSNDDNNNAANDNETQDNNTENNQDDPAEENTSGAVDPKSSSETVSFDQVSWIGGSPDRRSEPGVWFYTEDEHPEKYDDTFDWEDEDILLWQIGDEAYEGYSADTGKLEIMADDVIKIVVELEEDELNDDQAPRNYLKVPKDELEDKRFIVETIDGEQLTIQ